MNLSIGTFFYLFMRLFPFIIVCFFVIISIFNWDLKGLVYLVGLLITTSLFYIFNINNLNDDVQTTTINCTRLFDTNLPVNIIVIGFTIGYLFTTLILNSLSQKTGYGGAFNTESHPIILFFILIASSDLFINTNLLPHIPGLITENYCYSTRVWFIIMSGTIISGIVWANLICSTENDNYIFFKNLDKPFKKCKVNNTQYKCKTLKLT